MQAQGERRDKAPLILNPVARWWADTFTPRPIYSRNKKKAPAQNAGWAPEPNQMAVKRKRAAPHGFEPRTVQPASSRYTGHVFRMHKP